MKKTIFLLFLAAMAALSANAQYYIIDTLQLNSAYRALMAEPENPAKQMAFFEAFPASWSEYSTTYLNSPYGSDIQRHNPEYTAFDRTMGDLSFPHGNAFTYNLSSVPDSLYCKKILNLSTVAIYDDNIGSQLQMALRNSMRTRKPVMLELIHGMTPNDQMRLWLFYWATFVPITEDFAKEYVQLYNECAKLYPEDAAIVKIAFDLANGKTTFDGLGHVGQRKFFTD